MMKIRIAELKVQTGVGFGTSGIRDLNTNLTDKIIYLYTLAFLKHASNLGDFDTNNKVALAGDRRQSTARIMKAVAQAIDDSGYEAINCGLIPTPAVTLFGVQNHMPSIMVTGSHIPADRNGVKYCLSRGEILKSDEAAITEIEMEFDENKFDRMGNLYELKQLSEVDKRAYELYVNRYIDFFGNDLLAGKRIGLYGHSAVGRDLMNELLSALGAEVVKIEFSPEGEFVAVDTDTVNEELINKMGSWDKEFDLNYIISTDGDGDRPLLTDERGNFIRAEILPVLAAKYLEVEAIACTLTASTAIDKSGYFKKVTKTKVGSPQVIGGMIALEAEGYKRVAGYELNGGFLMQTDLYKKGKRLEKLATRDALLPVLSVIAWVKDTKKTVAQLVDELPKRFTYSSSIKGVATEKSLGIIERWEEVKSDIENSFGIIRDVNLMDGLRLTFEDDNIVHFRPSKNAPEFRNYTEAGTYEKAKELSEKAINLIRKWTV